MTLLKGQKISKANQLELLSSKNTNKIFAYILPYYSKGAGVNLSQARPNILPQFFLLIFSYTSILKPKI